MKSPIFFFAMLALISLFSCKGPKGPETPSGTFPEANASIKADQAADLTFSWTTDEVTRQAAAPGDQSLQLFRMTSATENNGKKLYQFTMVEEHKVESGKTSVKRSENNRQSQQTLPSDNIYAWRVVGTGADGNRVMVHSLSSFGVGNPSNAANSFLQVSNTPSIMCYDTIWQPNCSSFDIKSYECGPIIHIVNLESADFLSNNLQFRSMNYDTIGDCINLDPTFMLEGYLRFSVDVPCEKKNIVGNSFIQTILFKDRDTIPAAEMITKEIRINDTISTDLIIKPDQYLENCSSGKKVCKALVNVYIKFEVKTGADGQPLPYDFVFYLPMESTHVAIDLVSQSLNHAQTAARQGKTHQHNVTDCTSYSTFSLDYYLCLDSKTGEHVSGHVVPFHLNFCPI
ncbi:MAG: hypothetical protein H6562_04965 [Lewinellaceae bacterium]|nr:hypothetical protein [Lewinellaceae bacterium]